MKLLNLTEVTSTKSTLAATALAGTSAVGTEQGWLNENLAIIIAIIAFGNMLLYGFDKYMQWRRLKGEEDGRNKSGTTKAKKET